MTQDKIADFFSSLDEDDSVTYPGSRHPRRPKPEPEEITEDSWQLRLVQYKTVRGRRMALYPIGALAEALNRTPFTIRRWTRLGFIPHAPYRLPGTTRPSDGVHIAGRRLYTREMIESLVVLFRERGLLDSERVEWKNYPDLPELIQKTWTALYEDSTPAE